MFRIAAYHATRAGRSTARGLTIAGFTTFCAAHQVRIATATYLQGPQRIPDRFDTNLRATWAVFELR